MTLYRHCEQVIEGMRKDLECLEVELRDAGMDVRRDEPMSAHTTYQIGGPADLFVVAQDRGQLLFAAASARARGIVPFLLGGGANLLVADAGIRGLVIAYCGSHYSLREQDGEVLLTTEAGAPISELARETIGRGLEGLEWAVDVPGTVGGAVVGNAGAFGGYVCDSLRAATVLEPDGVVHKAESSDIEFCYRGSKFKRQAREKRSIVLEATFALRPGDANEIAARAAQYTKRRWERHPTEPSCGSVFMRTEHYPAGFLIEQCGLKGERRGDAMISPKHANFIVNLGQAKAADVKALIDLMRERVKTQFGEELRLEIELVGQWDETKCV